MKSILILGIFLFGSALAAEPLPKLVSPDQIALTYFTENWITLKDLKGRANLSDDEQKVLDWKASSTLTWSFQIYILTKYGERFQEGREEQLKKEYLRAISRVVSVFDEAEIKYALRLLTDVQSRNHSSYRWSIPDYSTIRFDKDLGGFMRLGISE